MKRGILLMNTGSPDSTAIPDVKRYLSEFLMDPYVIDLPWPLRALLVHGIILPRRPTESAKAYETIWSNHGSPLIHYCTRIAQKLNETLDVPVELGMAYGNPSLPTALNRLLETRADEICLLPLFPQYAMATVGSCIAGTRAALRKRKSKATLRVAPPFYQDPTYTTPIAHQLSNIKEHILFSYHGLPERHLKKSDPTGHHCLETAECCHTPSAAHATCYRHQCLTTTRAIAEAADLSSDRYTIAFQSRLGRAKWMEPYTDEVLRELPRKGIKQLAVVCPAFFCDCLETLEEIEIRGKETFLEAGGETFRMIPCLNDSKEAHHCLETLAASAGSWPIYS